MGLHIATGRQATGLRRSLVTVVITASLAASATFVAARADRLDAAARTESVTLTAAGTHLATFDAQMITLVNRARAAAHVSPVVEARGLDKLALWWSAQLDAGATSYNLAHNPNAWNSLPSYGAANRTAWGENVAWSSSTATTSAQLFAAYMNSPGHRANILSASFHYVGMGTVGGEHGLFNTTEFTDQVQPGQAIVPPAPVDFIRDTSTGAVYRLVGGAPVYVSSWTAFGGAKPTRAMSHGNIAALRPYPVDGTFVRVTGSGAVYRIAGGAPTYVSSWTSFGGAKPAVVIDPAAVARAGTGGYFNHLRQVPANGTFVRGANRSVFRIAGGAPLFVASWAPFGGIQPTTQLDPLAITDSGAAGYWAHVNKVPANNTYIEPVGSPAVYRVLGGVARHIPSWASVGGKKPVTLVDPLAISRAGTGGVYDHLLKS